MGNCFTFYSVDVPYFECFSSHQVLSAAENVKLLGKKICTKKIAKETLKIQLLVTTEIVKKSYTVQSWSIFLLPEISSLVSYYSRHVIGCRDNLPVLSVPSDFGP